MKLLTQSYRVVCYEYQDNYPHLVRASNSIKQSRKNFHSVVTDFCPLALPQPAAGNKTNYHDTNPKPCHPSYRG